MKSFLVRFIIMLGMTALLGSVHAHGAETVPLWHRTDIVLHSGTEYENPYTDVEINAVFTHEDGETIALCGFWNGGDEWRVRFAPTKTGRWDYVVRCSDADNRDLDGASGSLLAVENDGATELDRHGFVRVSDSGRYFVYDDGTPFFWLGDTNWQAPNYVSITQCNYPGCSCSNQFRHEVDDRLAKGFTVYQTYFDSAESDGGGQRGVSPEPSMWKVRHTLVDPTVFTEKFDKMFDYLADRGMVIALGFGVHSSTVGSMTPEALDRISRYLTARYASYPVIWITAQEITGDEQYEAWVRSAEITAAGDGYGHPQSAHQFPMTADNRFVLSLNRSGWHDFFALQNGHGPSIPKKSTYEGYWNTVKPGGGPKPFVETEANYEDIYCGGFNGYEASRISAWKAVLCGSCGFTYGVTGIWANCYSTAGNTGWIGTYSPEPWYMGLDKPGACEVGYLAAFMKEVGFEALLPRFDDPEYADFLTEQKVLVSTEDGGCAVAYFYNDDRSTGVLRKLRTDAEYRAFWFDPLTGKYIPIGDAIHAADGHWAIPEKPNSGDWVLLLTDRADFVPAKTEAMPEYAPEADEAVNLLRGAAASAGTFSAAGSEAERAIDGRSDTWWCASDGSFPQWISFDLGEVRDFNTLSLRLYPGTASAVWTVEISADGEGWETIRDHERQTVDAGSGCIGGSLGETCSARCIRVTFHEVVGNWAAVVEAEASLSETADRELPDYGGSLQTPEVRCVGSAVYSASGRLDNTDGNLTDGSLETEWTPFAPEATQTILCDLGAKKPLCGMNVVTGAGSSLFHIRIEGSEDGEDWTLLKDTKTGGRAIYHAARFGDRAVLSEALTGEYRYVKLLVFGTVDKNSPKSIAALELYAEDTVKEPAANAQIEDEPETTKPSPEQESPRKNLLPVLAGTLIAAGVVAFVLGRRKKKR